jgi:hypothetical protein
MGIRRIPVKNAATNQDEILEGEVLDVLPDDRSIYVDRTGTTYDTTKTVRMNDLPTTGLLQLPRTTWFGFQPGPIEEPLVIVGYVMGPDGCVPIYERRSDAYPKNRRPRADAVGTPAPAQPRRNWRARKAARATGALESADSVDLGGHSD